MTYLLLQIALYLAAVFVLGIALGWAMWGRRGNRGAGPAPRTLDAGASPPDDTHALADALARVNQEKSELAKRLAELEKS